VSLCLVEGIAVGFGRLIRFFKSDSDWGERFVRDPAVGGKLKQIVGPALVEEVEAGEIKDIDSLVEHCVIDPLLFRGSSARA
jgi:hypothetical protein